MVRHAIASEDKRARREIILAAAGTLFASGDGSLPSAAEIATEAGLAKGTVYLYFQTKEEIFLALLSEGLLTLLNEIEFVFKSVSGGRAAKAAAFLATYVSYVDRRPELLRLDALSHGVLEKNLDSAKLDEFRLTFVARLAQTGIVVEQALRLSGGLGAKLLMRTFAMTRGLWQSFQSHEEPKVTKADPTLASMCTNFHNELTEALMEYWRGALATHRAAK